MLVAIIHNCVKNPWSESIRKVIMKPVPDVQIHSGDNIQSLYR